MTVDVLHLLNPLALSCIKYLGLRVFTPVFSIQDLDCNLSCLPSTWSLKKIKNRIQF